MTASDRILIAGAGWRVTRFVVPALLNEGVTPERIAILRRSAAAGSPAMLEGIRIVTDLRDLADGDFAVTINCVARESLVAMERALISRAPRAIHFCDTPIFDQPRDLLSVLANSRARLFSLEDWTLMPNLRFLSAEAARAAAPTHLRVEHFGIVGHFLALYRSLAGVRLDTRRLVRRDADILGQPARGKTVAFAFRKDLTMAKAWVRTGNTLIEDFHEVEMTAHDNPEILYRTVDDTGIRYLYGARTISAHSIRPSLLATFAPFDDRKNVHELDKFVGLTTLFSAVLDGRTQLAYSYLHSVRDAISARRLDARGASLLF